MAYEAQTYEAIMARVLARVSPDTDTREGSVIWDATAPASLEMAILYSALDFILSATFADTAPRPYLIKRAAERGLAPKPATSAVFRGEFDKEVAIGSRFSLENLNYIVTERIEETGALFAYRVQCETPGAIGNTLFGSLIPIEYIDGLTSAELSELLIPGADEEETEAFRRRYMDSLKSQAFGGNIADYEEKVLALPGIGAVKVFPTWNGGGTVKLVVLDSAYGVPTDDLIMDVQDAIDPPDGHGEGLGLAPIGHTVTVEGARSAAVDISLTLTYQAGWDWAVTEGYVLEAIDAYFGELARDWQGADALTVRVSQIETRILDCPGITDIRDTLLNGTAGNLTLDAVHIPVRGVVSG